jgi:yecA family protein
MSSLAKRYRNGAAGGPDAGKLMPPDLRTYGAAPFDEQQRARLIQWLDEAAWPRGHMDITELEGYLVALIAWPVGIAAGAWLPPIWGVRGWKIPPQIASQPQFDEFIALIIGFLQDLDRQLSNQGSRFQSSVLRSPMEVDDAQRLHAWGRGFMTALMLGSQGLQCRNAAAAAAVKAIADTTSASARFNPRATDEVLSAVIALVEQRVSRGPLGPLPNVDQPGKPA